MSFTIRNITVLNYGNGFTLWHYKCPTDLLDCWTKGYFDSASGMLADRDMMLISAKDGGAQVYLSVDAGAVRLLLMART